ncbi:hypothetical protein TrRE_jg2940 [Triparma retinervis]|uniref:Uncharacterized protein n=1 Tax=Triparma retinervis TaxID=2557542 RepID=A0A9W6ZUA8_9STRA|nr:hypothetical protein TrRE_jg2940 [Triparma retinervis]
MAPKRKSGDNKTPAKGNKGPVRSISPICGSMQSAGSASDVLTFKGDACTLYLDDDTSFRGYSFGAKTCNAGEVVFNTSMVGYPEALTDPSYRAQILVLTFPLVGNYGVPDDSILDELGLPKYFESDQIHIAGLVVSEYSWTHSHWAAKKSLSEWLTEAGIPAIYGVDTRMLTKKIRETGAMCGKIEIDSLESIEFDDPNKRNLVAEVSLKTPKVYNKGAETKIVAYDCGMKYNIIRYLAREHNVELTVVPFDYDLEANPANLPWDGLFLSNGPGDPSMCAATVKSIKYALALEPPKPIFGICLGNQLLALSAGAKTYKMKYGNRGMNQPCIDLRTSRCYITPQNHGFAVDTDSLPADWQPLFLNANDKSNEGITHSYKPFFSAQFHPEAAGGPTDTSFLFDKFIGTVRGEVQPLNLLNPMHYDTNLYKKVLLVGSGGLSIGQAGEFDYSGSQCIKALKEEGIETILINPNIATVQTSPSASGADRVYFLPVRAKYIQDIILKEKPDGIIVSMGGQTALNVGIELFNSGFLAKENVKILGTQIPVIEATEDREIFSEKLAEIGESIALSYPATDIEEAKVAANKIGYPVLIRAAFALGGLGSGFAANDNELVKLAKKAFTTSDQILIDQDLRGWKEVEYEVVRDSRNNCITVCNMENFDPLGIHTGDSIVIAPSQTLSNREYFMLRTTAIKVVRHLGIVGECNIQYALHPESERYCIIEVNARLSRSSALASKATGYPLAYVATKLSLGQDLVSLRNSVTKTTTACFEPSLDYCVLKMPRWDLKKFNRVDKTLGSSMLSVGEVMAIGRNFEEVIQKACRMMNQSLGGIEGDDSNLVDEDIPLDEQIKIGQATDTRLFAVQAAFERGYDVEKVFQLSKIDRWFLSKLKNIADMKAAASNLNLDGLRGIPTAIRALKVAGFSDRQIAKYVKSDEIAVRNVRKDLGIIPVVKQIDTLAAEFPAQTNYLYVTYSGSENDVETAPAVDARALKDKGVMVLGCGAYCIGSSVEFDWCAVSATRQLRKDGFKAIVVNYNPETVSTDYDESDRLYFEELTLERTLDIYEAEGAGGVIVSVGGQIPNNLSTPLSNNGVNIMGTKAKDIDNAEDREVFSKMLDDLNINQPKWSVLTTVKEALLFAKDVGFPVLVRPSFVLSGAAMRVCTNNTQLENFLGEAAEVAGDKPVVVTQFILNAKEIEFDGVAQNGTILNYAIGEHLENAGVHSGDATVVLPAQKLYVKTIRHVKKYAAQIAKGLNISGPFNIQFMAKGNYVQVIECNLRASRTFPFVSKTLNANFISLATQVMCGMNVKPYRISLLDIDYVCVKAAMFSFTRLRGADPKLGVEMSSTGEVACFGSNAHEAFLLSLLSTGFKLPGKTNNILLSIAENEMRSEFTDAARILDKLGYNLFGTTGTAAYYDGLGINIKSVTKPEHEDDEVEGGALKMIKDGFIDMTINVPEGTDRKDEITAGYILRRASVDFGSSLISNVKSAIMLAEALEYDKDHGPTDPMNIGEFHKMPMMGGWDGTKTLR